MLTQKLMKSTALMATMVGFTGVVAQDAQDKQDRVVDTIVVTSAKREQTLQDIPVAVSVVNTDTIEKSAIVDIIDLQNAIPSLRVTQLQTSSQTNFLIRGFGNGANNTGIENSVGVFVDGVYRSRTPAAILDLPVLERIEVLRGPQSTLFGKNTSAGVISIVTQKPQQEFGGAVEATYGNYNQANFKGTLTGPLSDELSFRVSGSYNNRDGYYTNTVLNNDINDRDRWSIRAQLQFDPNEKASFRLIGDYNKIEEVCCGALQLLNGPATQFIGAPVPFGLGAEIGDDSDPSARTVAYDVNPVNRLVGQGLSLQSDFDLGWANLTSITAYRKQTDSSDSEVDFSSADIASIPAARDFKTFTQEFRLTNKDNGGDVDWLFGAFIFDEKVNTGRSVIFGADARAYIDGLSMGGITGLETALMLPAGTFYADGTGIIDNYTMDNKSLALNGQIDLHVTDRFTLTGGMAYLRDKKTVASFVNLTEPFNALDLVAVGNTFLFQGAFATTYAGFGVDATMPAEIAAFEMLFPGTLAAVTAGSQAFADANDEDPLVNPVLPLAAAKFFEAPVNFPNSSEDGILKGDKTTYSVKGSYEVNDNVNVYVSYSTGWKAGAYNLSSDSRPPSASGLGRTADPEFVKVFEAGVKANFNRGSIYFAVFDQTIEGFQSNVFNGAGFTLTNAGKQSVKGFEIETMFQPVDPLVLTFGLTYLDPLYDSFEEAACASFDTARCGAGQITRDLSGEKPAGIHEVSFSTSATYTHEFSNGTSAFIHADYLYESNVQALENVPASIASREVNLVNLSAGVTLKNGIELTGWVRNVTNDTFLLSTFPTVIQTGSYSGYVNAPRTYGATLRKRF